MIGISFTYLIKVVSLYLRYFKKKKTVIFKVISNLFSFLLRTTHWNEEEKNKNA